MTARPRLGTSRGAGGWWGRTRDGPRCRTYASMPRFRRVARRVRRCRSSAWAAARRIAGAGPSDPAPVPGATRGLGPGGPPPEARRPCRPRPGKRRLPRGQVPPGRAGPPSDLPRLPTSDPDRVRRAPRIPVAQSRPPPRPVELRHAGALRAPRIPVAKSRPAPRVWEWRTMSGRRDCRDGRRAEPASWPSARSWWSLFPQRGLLRGGVSLCADPPRRRCPTPRSHHRHTRPPAVPRR